MSLAAADRDERTGTPRSGAVEAACAHHPPEQLQLALGVALRRRQQLVAGAAQQACAGATLDERYWLLGVACGYWTSPAIEAAVDAALSAREVDAAVIAA